MTSAGAPKSGIAAGRLAAEAYTANWVDLHTPLSRHEASVEANRCYFCHDAPCVTACPTAIDIPMFIRQIMAGNADGAGKTILDQNILGGMCARVCPTETLCEQACVREAAEGQPVKIGLLQRHATDQVMAGDWPLYDRAASTGKRIAVVGSGPAGLACAHRLALKGHDVTIFEARTKAGGLNEYGIAAYKTVDGFAQREIEFILSVGGIRIEAGKALGRELALEALTRDFDAVFLGLGLAGVNELGLTGDNLKGVRDAVDFIAELRQTKDLSKLAVGRRVAVIGGGMTAIDAAVQSRLLGGEDVTILYRRGQEHMKASRYEQDLAQTKGVRIKTWARPVQLVGNGGAVTAVECEATQLRGGTLAGTGETFRVDADMVLVAIGQTFAADPLAGLIALEGGRIKATADGRTSHPRVWAGGDCIAGGNDLSVTAVAHGRDAAESIDSVLTAA